MPVPAGGLSTTPPAGAYAAPADLEGTVNPVPDNADLLLVRASRQVDRALLCAVYDATDADVIAALKAAVVEQVAGMLAAGDLAGLDKPAAGGFTLGRLSVQAPSGGQTGPARTGVLYDQAWLVLQLAGLTGQGPAEPGWPTL